VLESKKSTDRNCVCTPSGRLVSKSRGVTVRTGCPLTPLVTVLMALVTVLILTALHVSAAVLGRHSARPASGFEFIDEQEQLVAIGRVKEIQTPHLFLLDQQDAGGELLVLTSTPLTEDEAGATVLVRGALRSLGDDELNQIEGWPTIEQYTRARLRDGEVLVASSVTVRVTRNLIVPPARASRRQMPAAAAERPEVLMLRPAMLAHHIDELAGQNVRIVNARVVGVFEPHAFLVESATRYEETLGQRDRILVLIDAGKLRVPAEDLVTSTVHVIGVARTVLGARVSAEAPWPLRLDRDLARRLEVRAAVVATSVRTADGTELTDRRPSGTTRGR
jgi:hypothetical protein